MESTSQPSTRKRSAKPASHAAEKDHSLKARRERNREAQHVFRKRRQAADVLRDQRTKRLEEVVEEMSSILIGLFDTILAVEELTTKYPSVATGLQQSMTQVLALAKEVVGLDSSDWSSPSENTAAEEAKFQSLPDSTTDTNIYTSYGQLGHEASDAYKAANTPNTGTNMLAPWTFVSPRDVYKPRMPLGSGYTSTAHLPPSPLDSIDPAFLNIPHANTTREIPGASYSFPFRLLEVSLTLAYSTIRSAPLAQIQRVFGRTLQHRKREDIIASIEWALGPGRGYMYQTSSSHFHNSDEFITRSLRKRSGGKQLTPEMLTAAGVYEHLKSLGAKMIDTNTMEIEVPATTMPTPLMASHAGSSPRSSINRKAAPSVLRLEVPLLMERLSQVGICLEDGPGYPRRDVHEVIAVLATRMQTK